MASGRKYEVVVVNLESLTKEMRLLLCKSFTVTRAEPEHIGLALQRLKIDAVFIAGSEPEELVSKVKSLDVFLPVVTFCDQDPAKASFHSLCLSPTPTDTTLSRIRDLIREKPTSFNSAEMIRIHAIQLNLGTEEVIINRRRLPVTPTEFRVIRALMLRPNQLVRGEDLEKAVWGGDLEESRLLYVNMSSLRRKIGQHAKYIKTIRNLGYFYRC